MGPCSSRIVSRAKTELALVPDREDGSTFSSTSYLATSRPPSTWMSFKREGKISQEFKLLLAHAAIPPSSSAPVGDKVSTSF